MTSEPSATSRRNLTTLRAAAALILVILIGAPSLLYPFSRDQGEYAYIASAALGGKTIYRDVFNVKPPLAQVVHELALLAFGHSMVAIRALDLLWQAATAIVILLIADRTFEPRGVGLLSRLLPVALWWLAALISLGAQNKLYAYHALPLVAPQSLLAARLPFMARDRERVSRPLRLALIALATVFALALLVGRLAWRYPRNYQGLFDVVTGTKPLAAVYEHPEFRIFGGGNARYAIYTELEAARHIEARSAPDETVFVWGFEPTVYFLSHRVSASRFIYNYPLYGDFPWPQLQEECLAQLERNPPRCIVVVRNDPMPWISGAPDDSRTALARFIRSRHRFEALIGDFTLYRRDD